LLQVKDVPGLRECCADIAEPYRSAFLRLPELFGGADFLDTAACQLPDIPAIGAALESLLALRKAMPDLPLSFDLADLRGYHYHNGVVFAAYYPGFPSAIARGGRYDGVGKDFGRARPATGFSMDLREIARLAVVSEPTGAILSPYSASCPELAAVVLELRQRGEVVVELLPGEVLNEGPVCNRRLVNCDGQWIIQAIN
jgi:ATP phosphoribosyltransferase regulatory subunit